MKGAAERSIQACLILVGMIHLVPVTGVVGSARLRTLYGITVDSPDLAILMRHRAALFGIIGVLLVAGAVRATLRNTALVVGLTSVASFLLIAVSVGRYNAQLGRVVAVDVGALVLLLGSAIIQAAHPGGRAVSAAREAMYAKAITPILNVSDLAASFAWFEKLGWKKLWDWGEPPSFGSVGSGECEIFLCRDGQGSRGRGGLKMTFGPEGDQTGDKGVWMSVWVDDVDAIHRRCLEQGLDVSWPPTDMPWGVREMHLRHPDGHVFRISRGVPEE